MTTRIVNRHKEKFDIYIGRGTKWGNIFEIERDSKNKEIPGSRDKAIRRYREWILNKHELLELIPIEIKNKTLGCSCKPKPCHGDVLVELADK